VNPIVAANLHRGCAAKAAARPDKGDDVCAKPPRYQHNKIEDTEEEHLELAVTAFDRLADKAMAWLEHSADHGAR